MNKQIILTLSLISLLLTNCKKEDDKDVTFLREYSQKSIPINANGRMVDMKAGKDNYTFLIDRGFPVVLRMNLEGEVMWEKEFTQYSVSPYNLEVMNDGSCYFTINYYDRHMTNHSGFESFLGYFSDSYTCAILESSINGYSLRVNSLAYLVDNSTTKLVQLNDKGDLMSEKDYSLVQNGDFLHQNSDRLFFTTTYNSSKAANFTIDNRWGSIPTVTYEFFNSGLIFNEIDPSSNTTIRTMNSVETPDSNFTFPSEFTFGKMLFVGTSAIFCSNYNLIKITGNGLPTPISTRFKVCENDVFSYKFKSMAKGSNDEVIVLGEFSTGASDSLETIDFIMLTDLNGNEVWLREINHNLENASIIRSGSDNGFFLRSDNTNLHKYDNAGGFRWTANSSTLRTFTEIMDAHEGGLSVVETDGKSFFIKRFTEL